MVDTVRTFNEIQTILANNSAGEISPQDIRDAVISLRAWAGSGNGVYADGAALLEVDAQAISADTRTLLTIDSAGGQTELRWLDRLLEDTWSSNSHRIIEVGQTFEVTVEFSVKKTSVSTDAIVTLTHDIGSDPLGSNSIVIFRHTQSLSKAQNITHFFTKSYSAYGKETYFANRGRFYIECNEDIAVWAKEIQIKDTGTPSL